MTQRFIWKIAQLCLVLFVAHAPVLEACSCIAISPERKFKRSSEVFVGTVMSVETGRRPWPEKITMKTIRWFLGGKPSEVTFLVAGGLCSEAPTSVGAEALIYAERNLRGELVEIECASVALVGDHARREIAKLRHWSWWWRFERWLRQVFTGKSVGGT